jgi:tuberous sclerosis 2
MPACYVNFTEGDYRRVFGIALQYIQYHQSSNAAREDFKASPSAFALSQYVMMLAYYNLALWFMLLRVSERPKHMQSIARGLLLANDGLDKISDQTEVMFDFLARMTHANAQPKPKRSFINNMLMGPGSVGIGRPGVKDSTRITKSWLFGQSLVTITSLHRKGWLEIVIRRPSGSTSLLCKVENEEMDLPELEDLPEMLLANRKPNDLSKPILRAPSIPSLAVEKRLRGIPSPIRRLQGPAQMSLGRRPRALSQGAGADIFGGQASSAFTLPKRPEKPVEEAASPYQGGENKVTRAMQEFVEGVMRVEAHQSNPKAEAEGEKDKSNSISKAAVTMMDPSYVALQLSSYPDINLDRAPLILPDEPATDRMVRAVDLTPVVDFHKIGVLYVGKGQTTEQEILGNRYGSAAYSRFLAALGDLVTLKGQEDLYTGGLDRSNDDHGRYAYVWGDEITQIVYHTATLMPNKLEDPNHGSKKALIGNDWVHIVFNESGSEYTFGTIPSQFNYVNVVVSPDSRGGVDFGSVAMDDVIFCESKRSKEARNDEVLTIGSPPRPSLSATASWNARLLARRRRDDGFSRQFG